MGFNGIYHLVMSRSYRVDGPFMDDLPFFPPINKALFSMAVLNTQRV